MPSEDSRRLELALDAGELGVWEWEIAEQRAYWSPRMERIHGLDEGSFDGSFEAYQRNIHPDDRSRVLGNVRSTLENGPGHAQTYRIVRPDGEVRWVQTHARTILDAAGVPQKLVGVCRDVTEDHSRQQMTEILDSIADPFTVYDREMRTVYCNRAAVELGGFAASDIIGKRPWDIMSEVRDTAFVRAYEQAIADHQPRVVTEYFAPFQRWFEASIYPLADGISVQVRDVTAKKASEELAGRVARHTTLRADVSAALADARDLRQSVQRVCEALVANLDVAFARLWTVDDTGTMLLLQASAGMYTHVDGPHGMVPVGKFKIGLIAEERKPHLTNDVAHDPRVGDPAWAAREKMVAFAGYPLLVDGNLHGVLAMFSRDKIHEDTLNALGSIADLVAQGIVRRRAELELEQRVAELARSNADLEQFAYVASHDLQEPLRMVSSFTQLLARRYKGKLGDDADEFIGFAVEGVTRMQRLINDLLAYSRVGTRGRELGEIELEGVRATALANLQTAITESGATITYDPLPRVRGDEGQLVQVLQNLVSNAIKFRGEEPARIHIGATTENGKCTISVADNGIGIEPRFFDRIFVIFQRLHPREQYPGTGIGLAITKKIVERHGGQIWVESTPGKGSTISFTLPAPRTRRVA